MTQLRCWPGCTAIVIEPAAVPENVGRMVRVTERCPTTFRLLYPELDWTVEAIGEPLVAFDLGTETPKPFRRAMYPDRCLQPLRPPADPITTERDLEEPQPCAM